MPIFLDVKLIDNNYLQETNENNANRHNSPRYNQNLAVKTNALINIPF